MPSAPEISRGGGDVGIVEVLPMTQLTGTILDRIVAETNQGGALVELTIRTIDPTVPYTSVWASRGKYIRAEPIAMCEYAEKSKYI